MRETLGVVLNEDSVEAHSQRMALATYGIRLASAALAYVLQVALARMMGASDYGVFVYVWTWVLLVGLFTGLGFNESVRRFLPQYLKAGNHEAARGFIRTMYASSVAFSLLFSAVGAGIVWTLGEGVLSVYTIPLYLGLILVPIYTLLDNQIGEAMSRSTVFIALVPPYILRPVLTLGLMVAAVSYGAPANVQTAFYATIAAVALSAVVQGVFLRRSILKELPAGPRSYDLGKWVKVSLPLLAVEGFYSLNMNIDVLILGAYVDAAQIAIYYAAIKLMALVAFLNYAIAQVAARYFAEMSMNEDRSELAAYYVRTIGWTFWPSLGIAICLIIFGAPLLSMFGSTFTAGYELLIVFAISMVFQSMAGSVFQLMNMSGNEHTTLKASIAGFVLNVALNVIFIPMFGLMGAAIATAIGLNVQTLLVVIAARRYLGLTNRFDAFLTKGT